MPDPDSTGDTPLPDTVVRILRSPEVWQPLPEDLLDAVLAEPDREPEER